MGELLSYRRSKRPKTRIWIGAAAMIACVCALQSFYSQSSADFVSRIVAICILAIFTFYFVRKTGIGLLADDVYDLGDRLRIRRGKIIETVLCD